MRSLLHKGRENAHGGRLIAAVNRRRRQPPLVNHRMGVNRLVNRQPVDKRAPSIRLRRQHFSLQDLGRSRESIQILAGARDLRTCPDPKNAWVGANCQNVANPIRARFCWVHGSSPAIRILGPGNAHYGARPNWNVVVSGSEPSGKEQLQFKVSWMFVTDPARKVSGHASPFHCPS